LFFILFRNFSYHRLISLKKLPIFQSYHHFTVSPWSSTSSIIQLLLLSSITCIFIRRWFKLFQTLLINVDMKKVFPNGLGNKTIFVNTITLFCSNKETKSHFSICIWLKIRVPIGEHNTERLSYVLPRANPALFWSM